MESSNAVAYTYFANMPLGKARIYMSLWFFQLPDNPSKISRHWQILIVHGKEGGCKRISNYFTFLRQQVEKTVATLSALTVKVGTFTVSLFPYIHYIQNIVMKTTFWSVTGPDRSFPKRPGCYSS